MTDLFGRTRAEHFYDGIHLAGSFLATAADKLRAASSLGRRALADTALTSVVTVGSECRLRNIATGLPYHVSSIYGFQPQPFLAEPSGSLSFHDEAPAIEFDLQSAYWIERIVVHNSVAGPDRARSLAVSLSNDRVDYQPVFAPDQAAWPVFGAWQDALTIEIDATAPQRFVKLHLREKTYFHLDCVQVYVRSFLSDTDSRGDTRR